MALNIKTRQACLSCELTLSSISSYRESYEWHLTGWCTTMTFHMHNQNTYSPFFFFLWLITACLRFPVLQPFGCSSCPRVITAHRPLCTICHLITDRFASGGTYKVLSAESLWTLMSNGTDLWKPTWWWWAGGSFLASHHHCLEMSNLLCTADNSCFIWTMYEFIFFKNLYRVMNFQLLKYHIIKTLLKVENNLKPWP